LAQSAERTRPVKAIVCVGPEIAIDELTFEGAIREDRELARNRVIACGLPMRAAKRR
jgi:hypothetical protein